MIKLDFNEGWSCYKIGEADRKDVRLPYDAMIYESRAYSEYGHHNGFFKGYDYIYEKQFDLSSELEGKKLILEFEGVYPSAKVFLNGSELGEQDYGYNGFYIDITDAVKSKANILRVEVCNSLQPNSRWYTGGGIYRPVWLLVSDKDNYIEPDGTKIRTLSIAPAEIMVTVKVHGTGEVFVSLKNKCATVCKASGMSENGKVTVKLKPIGINLWDTENPFLYDLNVCFGNDEENITFGIRLTELCKERGLLLNGKRVILNGCCIHHDNGLLGAEEYDDVAERKIRLLKEVGYNAIRSAHNPCSKAILKACDKLGMLVVDEYTDMWYIHKNKYDYAGRVEKNYKRDIKNIVDKDYNHPCVIMYSSGNEVAETSQKRGVELAKILTDCFHLYDNTRPVTCGINIFFNFMARLGIGLASDKPSKKQKEAKFKEAKPKKKTTGSEFFNNLAGLIGSDTMKVFAMTPPCDWATKKVFANMDVAGYNYGITRYRKDLKKYPNRFILGAETFITDAYKFYEIAKNNPRILGDFCWTGIDYIGEVGLGSLDYAEYAKNFEKDEDWLTAGCGCLDITGAKQGHTAYTQVVYGVRKLAIAVQPVNHSGEGHMSSAWRKIHAFENWSWNGFDGHNVLVEVFSRAHKVGLFINGKKVGVKKPKKCRARFKTFYHDGYIEAVAYDKTGREICRERLNTANDDIKLTAEPERSEVRVGEFIFVRLRYTDNNGITKPLVRGQISVSVDGGDLVGLGNGCPYNPYGYKQNTTDTYYGEALAVIRPDSSGKVTIKANSDYGCSETIVNCI